MERISIFLRTVTIACIVLSASCGSELSSENTYSDPEVGSPATGTSMNAFESVRIVSGPNGLAHIVLNLASDGGVVLQFTPADDGEIGEEVNGRWIRENDIVRITFDETDLGLAELFCDYPSVENTDELIFDSAGFVEFKPFLQDSIPHVNLYIWGILCGAEYR